MPVLLAVLLAAGSAAVPTEPVAVEVRMRGDTDKDPIPSAALRTRSARAILATTRLPFSLSSMQSDFHATNLYKIRMFGTVTEESFGAV